MVGGQLELLFGAPQPAKKRRKPVPRSLNAVENNRRYRAKLKARTSSELPPLPKEKRCPSCEKTLPSTSFHKCRTETDGLKRECKACRGNQHQARRHREAVHVSAKLCCMCLMTKPSSGFSFRAASIDKLAAHCKECERKRFLPWYENNWQSVSESATRWARENPDAVRESRQVRRQKRRAREHAGGPFDLRRWRETLTYFDHHCAYCLRHKSEAGDMTVEHILPLSKGGTNDPDNLVPACLACNIGKSSRPILHYLLWLGRFPREVAA